MLNVSASDDQIRLIRASQKNFVNKLKNSLWYVLLLSKLKYGFCKKLLHYEWNSGQLPISFIKIRFSCNQNIEETLFYIEWTAGIDSKQKLFGMLDKRG